MEKYYKNFVYPSNKKNKMTSSGTDSGTDSGQGSAWSREGKVRGRGHPLQNSCARGNLPTGKIIIFSM